MIKVDNKRFYTIEEVASTLGISKQTLVRYERKGIIPRAKRNPINKWREYLDVDIEKLKKVMGRA